MVSELLDRMRELQRSLTHPSEDLPRVAWPEDEHGYELKPGESVSLEGESGVIDKMGRRAGGWVATIRMNKDKKLSASMMCPKSSGCPFNL